MIPKQKLDQWINQRYNVLFKGAHGVGKTSLIIDTFERHNLKWLYFSAATMDPWVDFIGVPKEKQTENGPVLDLVRPAAFATDSVEAIFFDEFNRSPKKVRNAVMELIQFKSINGKKFNNLKIVWAAINPDEDDPQEKMKYDVEVLDPAQLDRFHVHVDIPNTPDRTYFTRKFGTEKSSIAIDWWRSQDPTVKEKISPRRLDYALEAFESGIDIRDVLPTGSNITKLEIELKSGSIKKKIQQIFESKDTEEGRKFINDDNFFKLAFNAFDTKSRNDVFTFFASLLDAEKVSQLLLDKKKRKIFLSTSELVDANEQILNDLVSVTPDKSLKKDLKESLRVLTAISKPANWDAPVSAVRLIPGFIFPNMHYPGTDIWGTTQSRKATAIQFSNELPDVCRDAKSAQHLYRRLSILLRIGSSTQSAYLSRKTHWGYTLMCTINAIEKLLYMYEKSNIKGKDNSDKKIISKMNENLIKECPWVTIATRSTVNSWMTKRFGEYNDLAIAFVI